MTFILNCALATAYIGVDLFLVGIMAEVYLDEDVHWFTKLQYMSMIVVVFLLTVTMQISHYSQQWGE